MMLELPSFDTLIAQNSVRAVLSVDTWPTVVGAYPVLTKSERSSTKSLLTT